MIIRNWREIAIWLLPEFDGEGLDWRLFGKVGAQETELYKIDPKTALCLRTVGFVSFARLQPQGAYRAHANTEDGQQSEEIYCFIKGHGTVRSGENEIRRVGPGDIFYTPGGGVHHLINDGDEWIDFLAWSADAVEESIRPGVVKNWQTSQPILWHGRGVRWRMLSKIGSDADDGSVPCQRELSYADWCWLQGEASCDPDVLKQEEAVYFIISGEGVMHMGTEKARIRDGDAVYIPPNTEYQLVNDQRKPMELLAFGAEM